MIRQYRGYSAVSMPLLLVGLVFVTLAEYHLFATLQPATGLQPAAENSSLFDPVNTEASHLKSRQTGTHRLSHGNYSGLAKGAAAYTTEIWTADSSITKRMRALLQKCNSTDTQGLNILKTKKPDFVKRFKNPCWYEDKRLLCLPYIYLVGVAKCGTTDLFKRITLHPDFVEPTIKEPNWLSAGRFWRKETLKYYARKFFSPISDFLTKAEKEKRMSSSAITGEASVTTFEGAHDWPILEGNIGKDEPVHNNPDYIYHLNPEARILINLRNPIDRLWSEYLAFSKSRDKSAEDFHNIVQQEIMMYNQCLAQRSLRSCMYDRLLAVKAMMNERERNDSSAECRNPRSIVLLRRGVYHVFIKDYLRVFPRDHVLIQRLEDLQEDPHASLTLTYSFLGLKIPQKSTMKKILGMDVRNSRKPADKKAGGMLPATRELLYQFYKPHNKALAKLLNDDRYDYKDTG